MSAITAPIGQIGAAGITTAGNITAQRMANKTNVQMNTENNKANLALQKDSQEWQKSLWDENNAYNTPEAQVERMITAGINPLTAFGSMSGSSGNSSGPASAPAPAVMNAGHVDPLSMDNRLAEAVTALNEQKIQKYSNETARMKAESDIEFNAASTKNVIKNTEKLAQDIEVTNTMLPYNIQESIARTNDTNASAANKKANLEFIQTGIDKLNAEIFKTYEEVEMGWVGLDIQQQNADINQQNADTAELNAKINQQNANINQQNADTNKLKVKQDYDIALKNYNEMKLKDFMDFAKNYVYTDTYSFSNMLTNSYTAGGTTEFNAGTGIVGVKANASLSGTEGEQNTKSRGGTRTRIDINQAMEDYAKFCAMGGRLGDIAKNPAVDENTRKEAVDLLGKIKDKSENKQVTLNHMIRTQVIKNKSRLKQVLQLDASGLGNPLNGTSF